MGPKNRYLYAALFIISLIFGPAASGEESPSTDCVGCHADILTRAADNSFSHMIESIGCRTCHAVRGNRLYSNKSTFSTQNFMKDAIISLGSLRQDKSLRYEVKIEAQDPNGNKAEPVVIDAGDQMTLSRPENSFNIKRIFDVKVEKIKRGIFSTAVISWTTDVPSKGVIEYITPRKSREKVRTYGEVFSRRHKAVLQGIRNDSIYSFTITASDLNGNSLRSKKFTFDTNADLDIREENEGAAGMEPEISKPMFFRVGDRDEIFLRTSADKAVDFRISLTRTGKSRKSGCNANKTSIYSTIDVCVTCHPQNASHPVGIRSDNPEITVSDDLPMIDNGIITCVTCHYPHGGRSNYFLRAEFSKEICIKCHSKRYES